MYIKSDFSKVVKVMKWRYLDSLDSTRYSQTEFIDQGAPRKLRIQQATIEMIATMLMGNGIIVPNNQFIDSIGFLRIASTMIQMATKSKMESIFIPLLYANYDYSHEETGGPHLKNPFLLTAYLFNKADEKDPKYFELSAFPDLGSRRKEWAVCLQKKMMGIPSKLIKGELEEQLASDLLRILNFFSINEHLVINAVSTKGIREYMTASIAKLTNKNLENDEFFISLLTNETDYSNDRLMRLSDIIKVFKKLKAKGILDSRSLIRDDLIKKENYYFKGIKGSIELTRIGVLKTFNSIYNFSGYKSTNATQDNQTEPLNSDNIWGPDEAAFALGRWVRENYESKNKGKQAIYDIVSNQDLFVTPEVNDESIVDEKEPLKDLWREYFNLQISEKWETSLFSYINSLRLFEKVKQEFDSIPNNEKTEQKKKDLLNAANNYENCRHEHITNINAWLPTGYEIIPDEHSKLSLTCRNILGKIISKVQIEDFAEFSLMNKIEKGAHYASEVDKNVSAKGCIAEYGE